MLLRLEFLICSALIDFSGYKLSRQGDIIAEKSGVGRTWFGGRIARHGDEEHRKSGVPAETKSISEAIMKAFHKLTKKKDRHE